jgi:hypothetical protein
MMSAAIATTASVMAGRRTSVMARRGQLACSGGESGERDLGAVVCDCVNEGGVRGVERRRTNVAVRPY